MPKPVKILALVTLSAALASCDLIKLPDRSPPPTYDLGVSTIPLNLSLGEAPVSSDPQVGLGATLIADDASGLRRVLDVAENEPDDTALPAFRPEKSASFETRPLDLSGCAAPKAEALTNSGWKLWEIWNLSARTGSGKTEIETALTGWDDTEAYPNWFVYAEAPAGTPADVPGQKPEQLYLDSTFPCASGTVTIHGALTRGWNHVISSERDTVDGPEWLYSVGDAHRFKEQITTKTHLTLQGPFNPITGFGLTGTGPLSNQ